MKKTISVIAVVLFLMCSCGEKEVPKQDDSLISGSVLEGSIRSIFGPFVLEKKETGLLVQYLNSMVEISETTIEEYSQMIGSSSMVSGFVIETVNDRYQIQLVEVNGDVVISSKKGVHRNFRVGTEDGIFDYIRLLYLKYYGVLPSRDLVNFYQECLEDGDETIVRQVTDVGEGIYLVTSMTELKSIIEKTGLSFVDADDIRVWMSNRFNGRTPVLNDEILIISENATVKMIDDNYPYLFLIIRHQNN